MVHCWRLLSPSRRSIGTTVGLMNAGRKSAGNYLVRWRPRLPSTFRPPDARPPGTGRNRRGHRVTAGAVDGPFLHVTRDGRGRWGWDGTRGEAAVRPVKSPALPTQVRILSLPHYL